MKSGKAVEVQPPEGYVLNLQLAALHGENEKCAVVKVETMAIEGDPLKAVICTLRSKSNDQCNVNLVFGYDVSTKFSFEGDKSSTVYLSGYYQPAPEDMGSEDEFGNYEESDSDEDDEEKPMQSAPKESKLVVEEDSEGDDSDSDIEEDSVDEEFIKKMIAANKASASDSDSEEDSEGEDEEDSESESEEEPEPPKKVAKTSTPGKAAPVQNKTPQRPATAPQRTPQTGGNKNTPKGSSGKQAFSNQKSGDKRKR